MTWPLVEVVYHDAHAATSGWTAVENIDPNPAVIRLAGWRLPDTVKPGHVSIAQEIDEHGNVDNVVCVPNAMVQSVVAL